MAQKLEDCPFCGRKAEIFVHNGSINPLRKGMFKIECYDADEDGCGCQTEWFEKESDAIEYWNTRPTPQKERVGLEEQELRDLWMNVKKEVTFDSDYHPKGMDEFIKEICSKLSAPTATSVHKLQITRDEIIQKIRLLHQAYQEKGKEVNSTLVEDIADMIITMIKENKNGH